MRSDQMFQMPIGTQRAMLGRMQNLYSLLCAAQASSDPISATSMSVQGAYEVPRSKASFMETIELGVERRLLRKTGGLTRNLRTPLYEITLGGRSFITRYEQMLERQAELLSVVYGPQLFREAAD